jgi:hypothetical protein
MQSVPTIIPCDNPFKDHRQLRGEQGHFPSFNSYTVICIFLYGRKILYEKSAYPNINAVRDCTMYIVHTLTVSLKRL